MRNALLAAVLGVLSAVPRSPEVPATGAPERPEVRITSPLESDIPVGTLRIELEVKGILPGDQVDLFADGRKLVRLSQPPWSASWDAGKVPRTRVVSAVLVRDGREVATARVRTKSVGFSTSVTSRSVGISPVVIDKHGRYVPGLLAKDFTIRDNGTVQEIETFDANESPLSVVIVLDISGSMALKVADARRSAIRLVDALKPEDEAALLPFNSVIVGWIPFTKNRAAIRAGLEEARVSGETALYDATASALAKLKPFRRRKAVILFTDGEDNRSRLSVEQVIGMARASEASIYAVAQGDESKSKVLKNYLHRLAEESGGRSYFIADIKKLSRVFDEILSELRSQYFITYTPKVLVPNSWHDVEVTLNRSGLAVRAKKSYRVE
jgi:Ca-activated chloride channel family protein